MRSCSPRHAIPRLDHHRDLARDEIEPPGWSRSSLSGDHIGSQRLRVVGQDVRGAVLERTGSEGLLLGGRAGGLAEAELRPAQLRPPEGDAARGCGSRARPPGDRPHRPGCTGRHRTAPDPDHRRGKPATPPGAPADARGCRSDRRPRSRTGSARNRTSRSVHWREVPGLTGVIRRRLRRAACSVAPTSRPCVMRGGRVAPVLQQLDEVVTAAARSCRRRRSADAPAQGDDACLARAEECVCRGCRFVRPLHRPRSEATACRGECCHSPPARPRRPRLLRPVRGRGAVSSLIGRVRQERAVPVSWDSGSASALMRSTSPRLSASVRSERERSRLQEPCAARASSRSVAGGDLLHQRRTVIALRSDESLTSEKAIRALDVRGEVVEIGVRPPVLLAVILPVATSSSRATAPLEMPRCPGRSAWS